MPRRLTPAQERLLRYFFDRAERDDFGRLSHLGSNGNGGHRARTAESLAPTYLERTMQKAGRVRDGRGPWRDIFEPAYRITDDGVAYVERLGRDE